MAIKSPAQKHAVIPYGKQSIGEDDIQNVVEALRSNWITQGPRVAEFEKTIADYCGAKYAVAVCNGTAALHVACLAAGLGLGAEGITTPLTFLSTPNSVIYTGAKPVFADIHYQSGNIDPVALEKKITKRTRAILPVHFAGLPADMEAIQKIAAKRKLIVIEDACHALGAEYKGKKIGSCEYSDMAVFSFHPVKALTTGEGGCITTNNPKLYKRLKALSNHGIFRDEDLLKRQGGWIYEMRDLGFNYRLTDMQCALGLSQMEKLDDFIEKRRRIAERYLKAFSHLNDSVLLPSLFSDRKSAWHLFLFRVQAKNPALIRRKIYDALKEKGIYTQVHYIPVPTQPFYRKNFKIPKQDYQNAEKFYSETLSLPLFPGLTEPEIDRIIQSTLEVVSQCLGH